MRQMGGMDTNGEIFPYSHHIPIIFPSYSHHIPIKSPPPATPARRQVPTVHLLSVAAETGSDVFGVG